MTRARVAVAEENPAGDPRVGSVIGVAGRLADDAGIVLPGELQLFRLGVEDPTHAGVRTPGAGPDPSAPPEGERVVLRTVLPSKSSHVGAAAALVEALEGWLTAGERQRGAHYTPAAVADRVAEMALVGSPSRPVVVDPACGGGALLLAAARRLEAQGLDRTVIARDLLWGADVDPVAVAVAEAAIALWSGGTAPEPGHIVVADTLHGGDRWGPAGGFDVVVGNPPFQGQLATATARSAAEVGRLRARWGAAVSPYVDTAALFLLAAVDLARPGGRVAMIQPQSVVAARDAAGVRAALAARARLRDLWAPTEQLFGASVLVCVPVLDVLPDDGPARIAQRSDVTEAERGLSSGRRRWGTGASSGHGADGRALRDDDMADHGGCSAWASWLADGRGIPDVELTPAASPRRHVPTIVGVADVVAGFRDEYYGLVPHVAEADDDPEGSPLVSSGLIEVGTLVWGERTARFAKRRWDRPVVDVAAVRASSHRLERWLTRVLRPKVLVATQTAVVEAVADRAGKLVPVTPVIAVVPEDPSDVDRLTAVLCSPPVSAWMARRTVGTALSPGALRVTSPLVGRVPLPPDAAAWRAAADALRGGDLREFATAATAMYRLPGPVTAEVLAWWHARWRPS